MTNTFNLVQKEIDFYSKIKNNNDSLWSSRVQNWINKILDYKGEIKKESLINFRRFSTLLSETPNQKKNYFVNIIYKFTRDKGQHFSSKEALKNFSESSDYSLLHDFKMSEVGNPGYYFTKEGIKYNERFLRHIRNLENLDKYLFKDKNTIKNVIDIGGGYGQFSEIVKRKHDHLVFANIDFFEQLILAYYYLLENFPGCKIFSMSQALSIEKIDRDLIAQYDFLLIPVECFDKIENGSFDLLTNFSSFGEMPRDVFSKYFNSPLIKNIDYIYTVNRIDSWADYDNGISIFDYPTSNFKVLDFKVSPIWSYWYISNSPFSKPKKIAYRSRNFEFIGKNKNRYKD
jgi:putative sugar O-methyltransferase